MKIHERLAVFSWSLQPASPAALFEQLRVVGLPRTQVALDPIVKDPGVWGGFGGECRKQGVQIASGMFGTIGEDYSTMESIRRTGGLAPETTWEQNWAHILEVVRVAADLRIQ